MALPLGELSPKVTERACGGVGSVSALFCGCRKSPSCPGGRGVIQWPYFIMKETSIMMHLEADVFTKFDKQWALVTAGTPGVPTGCPGRPS